MKLRLKYNSPVILSFTFAALIVMVMSTFMGPGFKSLFTLRGSFNFVNPVDYFRLFSYILGHADWSHFLGNFALILLIGPILEEKYGSFDILLMTLGTALITAIINILLFDSGAMGASGVAFMMILLVSMTNFKSGEIPITFILVVLLYVGREVVASFSPDNVSQFGHIMGGICGAIFGFLFEGGFKKEDPPATTPGTGSEL